MYVCSHLTGYCIISTYNRVSLVFLGSQIKNLNSVLSRWNKKLIDFSYGAFQLHLSVTTKSLFAVL